MVTVEIFLIGTRFTAGYTRELGNDLARGGHSGVLVEVRAELVDEPVLHWTRAPRTSPARGAAAASPSPSAGRRRGRRAALSLPGVGKPP